jgi:hypothetical protein
MFNYTDFTSLNKLSELPAGEYLGSCSVYLSPQIQAKIIVLEYGLAGAVVVVSVVDLLIVDESGSVFFRDFIRMADLTWRDSYGLRRDSLGELLPPEILSFALFERFPVDSQFVGVSHV